MSILHVPVTGTNNPAYQVSKNAYNAAHTGNGLDILNAKDFGAVGDRVADDTVALQAFIDACCAPVNASGGRSGYIPDGMYKITAPLVFSNYSGWLIAGSNPDSVMIEQYTDNVPVFTVGKTSGGTFIFSWGIRGITFRYFNAQSSSNTAANAIRFDKEAFQGRLVDCKFTNCYYGIAVKTGIGVPWGTTWDNLVFGGLSGGALNWSGGVNAGPNNHFGRMYVDATTAVGPIFAIRGDNFVIDTIEVNTTSLGAELFHVAAGSIVTIGALKLENGTYTASKSLFVFETGCDVSIGQVYVYGNAMTVSGSGVTLTIANIGSGGSTGSLEIGALWLSIVASGGATVFGVQGTAGTRITIRSTRFDLADTYLLNQGATVTGNAAQVTDHTRRLLSDNLGDADYTATLGGATILSFETAFTVARVIDLPAVNNSLFNGLTYEIRLYGAVNGANTAIVKCNGTTLLTQTTDKVLLRFTYRRNASNPQGGWILTGYQSLP